MEKNWGPLSIFLGRIKIGSFKVLHPTCLYMQKIFQMAPAVNTYTHEYPTTSKYLMLPTHLRGEISLRIFASLPLDYMGIYKYLMVI